MGASLLAMRPHGADRAARQADRPAPHCKLASLSTASRRDVDYRLLDARLQQLMTQAGDGRPRRRRGRKRPDHIPQGLWRDAGRIGRPVTPETVFRWASVSKGVAATMVAKLAEQGKINLERAGRQLCAGPQAARRQRISRDRRRPAVAPPRPLPQRLRQQARGGAGPEPASRAASAQLKRCARPAPAGTIRTSPIDASSEMVSRITGMPYEQAVKRYLFNPIGMTQRQRVARRARIEQELGPAAQRRQATAADGRYLLQGARRRRHQQQHQGHGAVDAGADGRDARRARRQGARHHPRALCGDPDRARAAAQVPRAARRPPGTATAGEATIMPGTTSSAIAAGSTAIAR